MRSRSYASTVWRRVLLVADDARLRDSLTRSVREMGFEVRATALAENALRLLEQEQAPEPERRWAKAGRKVSGQTTG